jgi:hypothetical protein
MKVGDVDGLPALVVLEGGWKDSYADVMAAEGLSVLSIAVRGDDLSFLARLPDLRGLVLNAGEVRDLAPVEALGRLETLTLNTPTTPKLPLDFGAFEALRILRMYWNAGFASVFSCATLESLYVFSQPDPDLSRYGALGALRRLELSQGRKLLTTKGVGELDFLGLYQQGGLSELTHLPDLDVLSIQTAKKLDAIDAVAVCRSLTRLDIANCGDIASLQPLAALTALERLGAWESTRILDGDLSVLLRLPRLREVRMRDRREYRPRVSEIEAALAG